MKKELKGQLSMFDESEISVSDSTKSEVIYTPLKSPDRCYIKNPVYVKVEEILNRIKIIEKHLGIKED